MASIRLIGVGFRFGDAVDLLESVELTLGSGWTGVVGPNGAGKTTLLRLLAGELSPTLGEIVWTPSQPLVALCPQDVELDDAVRELALAWDKRSRRWRKRLGLDEDELERWDELSPGERKRWQIAAALAQEPDVLLLDEPTNHLDEAARALLVGALGPFPGVGLVVSHERALLDELTTTTLRVERGGVQVFPGPYGAASEAWAAARASTLREAAERSHAVRRARRQLAVARDERAGAEKSIRRRPKSPRDSDGRSLNRKGRAARAEATHARRLGAMKTRVARTEQAAVAVDVELGGEVVFRFEPAPKPVIATIDGPLMAGARTLAERMSGTVHRTSRIHLRGPNGAGKSTLLSLLVGAARVPPERMLVLPQELDRAARALALEEARRLDPEPRGRAMQLLALLGVDPGRLLASELPSPGEARKLVIAAGLAREVWCMFLDEPTNHLDLPSIERLERALVAFPGAIVLASLDAAFAAAICETTWPIGELAQTGGVVEHAALSGELGADGVPRACTPS